VVWSDDRDGIYKIHLYDLRTKKEQTLPSGKGEEIEPKVDGDRVVWMDKRAGDFDVYLYDISSGKELALATGPGDQSFPSINGNIVAWADNRTGEPDIVFIDLTTQKTTTLAKPGKQTDPKVYGEYIAYLNNGTEIYLHDIKAGADFAPAPGSIKMEPAISSRGVVWTDYREGSRDPDIYMYDFKILADVSITSGPFNHTNPAISEDKIVWTDNRNGHFNVYLFNVTTQKSEHNQ